MSQNPYAAPQSAPAGPEPARRQRWVAVLLALLAPPIAMLYVVRPLRAIAYLVVGVLMYPATVMASLAGLGNPLIFVLLAVLGWRLVGAIDGYRLASKWNGEGLPWYARAPALTAFLVAGWLSIAACRAFVVQPFKIPSASMHPTLRVGDHILVSKAAYGFSAPQRGDVAVFRFPQDRSLNYVMRVIGLPGESVAYADRRLRVDGRDMPVQEDGTETIGTQAYTRYQEQLGDVQHAIVVERSVPPMGPVRDFPGKDQCRHDAGGFTCKVPAGHYFVMGDNRDNAHDSRYWGFVPHDDFLGRAFLVWYSTRDSTRGGTNIR
jgi:signal peptidase I